MLPRFRLVFLFALCLALLSSGCTLLEKQRLPYQGQNDVSVWMNSIARMNGEEQGKAADRAWKSASSSQELKMRALSIAASRPGSQGFAARRELSALYAKAPTQQRASWETMYWNDLDAMGDEALKKLALSIASGQEKDFPWNLALLKAARKGLVDDAPALIARLSVPELYSSSLILGLMDTSSPQEGECAIALVLPQTGTASAIGRQIAEGAQAAAEELRIAGKNVELTIIDSGQSSWQQQVRNLPPKFIVIGGPLLPSLHADLIKAAPGRAVFSFTSSLPSGEEGAKAWRFFTSPEDQVRTLIDGASSLGITSFGIFSPEDSYSRRMGALFAKEVSSRGYAVSTGSYSPGKMNAWPKEAGAFVKTRVGAQRGSIPVATADFQAIFLPDSWKNMDMLVSSLHYSGAQNRLMMGTALWEQSLGPLSRNNAATFSLTIFPGTWNEKSPEPGTAAFIKAMEARNKKTNDWLALGFDFTRMASSLSLRPGWTPSQLNRILASAPYTEWAAAPIQWDSSGKAQRRLFLFQPSSTGYIPADGAKLTQRLSTGDLTEEKPKSPADAQKTSLNFEQLVNSITKN